jgi:hypothetical protein
MPRFASRNNRKSLFTCFCHDRQRVVSLLLFLATCSSSSLLAQTPAQLSIIGASRVRLGSHAQYTANVNGVSGVAVVWSVNGIVGGTSATGPISASGVYSPAPTFDAGHSVTIRAATESGPVSSASLGAKVLNQLPTIRSGSVTQTAPGSHFLLDIRGTGFVAASQLQIAGANIAAILISSTELQSSISLPAGTTTVTVGVLNGNAEQSAPVIRQIPVQAAPAAPGSSVTTIEPLGAIAASQAVNGLGFNVAQNNDWEFQMAEAAGATHARFQCGWTGTENQVAPPGNAPAATRFTLQSDCQAGLVSSFRYSMHPTILAAYGPPYHQILSVTVPAGAAAGATEINIQFASGTGGDTIASMAALYDTIVSSSNARITNKHSYAGGLITGVDATDSTHATLELASALSSALPADTITRYIINEYLYPPPASFSPTDPSVLAYAKYAEFLAGKISTSGVTGEVEIWNEPPWGDDPWDDRYDFYDNQPLPVSPGPQTPYLPNWGFAAALFNQTSPVNGVTYNWGGTEKTGGNSVLNWQMLANTGVNFLQPNTLLTTEAFHPYGNNPEDMLWSQPCLQATIKEYPAVASYFAPCNLLSAGPNFAYAAQLTLIQQSINSTWGIGHNITETGFSGSQGDDLHKARFVIRQFLGYQAAGVTPIQFYRLYDTSPDNFSFVSPTANADGTHSPLPAYTALAGLMSDLAGIKSSPYPAWNLPAILSYGGTYPLDTVSLVGSRAGDSSNSIVFALWQRSFTSGVWATLASPIPTPVTVQIPMLLTVTKVLNLDTRTPVAYTRLGQEVTFAVSDDPIEVLLEPAGSE